MPDDINEILGSAIEGQGLSAQQSSTLIIVIHELLKASQFYVTREQYEADVDELREYISYYMEMIEGYRAKERQCAIGGCIDIFTTEEVFLDILSGNVYLCEHHRGWVGRG